MENDSEAFLEPVTAAYDVRSPVPDDGSMGYHSPTPHSFSENPAQTGWATSQDPGDWGRSLISNNFGLTFDATLRVDPEASDPYDGPTVSGVALKAADTGRVLMIQRSMKDESDPAKGTWEFPGGHHEEGDVTSLHAGIREWQEETGQPFPEGGHVTHAHRTGPYTLHTVVIPEESAVRFHEGRSLDNPDDPDGDDHEQAAWWDPDHAKKNPALRSELKGHPSWGDIKKAAAISTPCQTPEVNYDTTINDRTIGVTAGMPTDVDLDEEQADSVNLEHIRKLRDEVRNDEAGGHWNPEHNGGTCGTVSEEIEIKHGYPAVWGAYRTPHHPKWKNPEHVWNKLPDGSILDATADQFHEGHDVRIVHPNHPDFARYNQDEPDDDDSHKEASLKELSLDDVLRVYTTLNDPPEPALPSTDGATEEESVDDPDDAESIRMAFLQSKGAQLVVGEATDILQKAAMKNFNHAEQQELINEGQGDRARNFGDLKITGTHYEMIPEDEDDLWFE